MSQDKIESRRAFMKKFGKLAGVAAVAAAVEIIVIIKVIEIGIVCVDVYQIHRAGLIKARPEIRRQQLAFPVVAERSRGRVARIIVPHLSVDAQGEGGGGLVVASEFEERDRTQEFGEMETCGYSQLACVEHFLTAFCDIVAYQRLGFQTSF